MPVIRQKQQSFTNRIAVPRLNSGGTELWQSISRNASSMADIAFKERDEAAVKDAQETANKYNNKELTLLDSRTGKPKVFSDYDFNPRAEEAFSDIIKQRYVNSITDQIQLRNEEFKNSSNSPAEYKSNMAHYLAELSNGAEGGFFKNHIESVGTKTLSLTHLEFLAAEKKQKQKELIELETLSFLNNNETLNSQIGDSSSKIEDILEQRNKLILQMKNLHSVGGIKQQKIIDSLNEINLNISKKVSAGLFGKETSTLGRARFIENLQSNVSETLNSYGINLDVNENQKLRDYVVSLNSRIKETQLAELSHTKLINVESEFNALQNFTQNGFNFDFINFHKGADDFFKDLNKTNAKEIINELGFLSNNPEISVTERTTNNNNMAVDLLSDVINELAFEIDDDKEKSEVISALGRGNLDYFRGPKGNNQQRKLLEIVFSNEWKEEYGITINDAVRKTLVTNLTASMNKEQIKNFSEKALKLKENERKETRKKNINKALNFETIKSMSWSDVVNAANNLTDNPEESKNVQLEFVRLWVQQQTSKFDDKITEVQAAIIDTGDAYNNLSEDAKIFVDEIVSSTFLRNNTSTYLKNIKQIRAESNATRSQILIDKDSMVSDINSTIKSETMSTSEKFDTIQKFINQNNKKPKGHRISNVNMKKYWGSVQDEAELINLSLIESITDVDTLKLLYDAITQVELRKGLDLKSQEIIDNFEVIKKYNLEGNQDGMTSTDALRSDIEKHITKLNDKQEIERKRLEVINNNLKITSGNYNHSNQKQIESYNNMALSAFDEGGLFSPEENFLTDMNNDPHFQLIKENGFSKNLIGIIKQFNFEDSDNGANRQFSFFNQDGQKQILNEPQVRKILTVFNALKNSDGTNWITNSLLIQGVSERTIAQISNISRIYSEEVGSGNVNFTFVDAVEKAKREMLNQSTSSISEIVEEIKIDNEEKLTSTEIEEGIVYAPPDYYMELEIINTYNRDKEEAIELLNNRYHVETKYFRGFTTSNQFHKLTENNIQASIFAASKNNIIQTPMDIDSLTIKKYRDEFIFQAELVAKNAMEMDSVESANHLYVVGGKNNNLSSSVGWKAIEKMHPGIIEGTLNALKVIENEAHSFNIFGPKGIGRLPVNVYNFMAQTQKFFEANTEIVFDEETKMSKTITPNVLNLILGWTRSVLPNTDLGGKKMWYYKEDSKNEALVNLWINGEPNKEKEFKRLLGNISANEDSPYWKAIKQFWKKNYNYTPVVKTVIFNPLFDGGFEAVDYKNDRIRDKNGDSFLVDSLSNNEKLLTENKLRNEQLIESNLRDEKHNLTFLTEEEKLEVDRRKKITEEAYDVDGTDETSLWQKNIMKFIVRGQSGSFTRNIEKEKENIINKEESGIVRWFEKNTNKLPTNPWLNKTNVYDGSSND